MNWLFSLASTPSLARYLTDTAHTHGSPHSS